VGVASGRAEFGPRALGNRSLLADPRGHSIKNRVNKIKRRQKFRPFAPMILEEYAAELGSDCPFFIENTPKIIRGRGEILDPCSVSLQGSHLVLIHPGIHVGTKEAYAGVVPQAPKNKLETILADRSRWKEELVNDFEPSVFQAHPELAALKSSLYQAGAYYAAMSGSGSSIFGLFDQKPILPNWPTTYFVFESLL